MNSAFDKLSDEKKEQIINICIEEFSTKGYEDTSTDIITNKAGISKGIIYYYFKNKRNLYFYLVDYAADLFINRLLEEKQKITANDFFERLKETLIVKIKICVELSREFQMLTRAFSEPSTEIKKEMGKRLVKLGLVFKTFNNEYVTKHFDKSKLREDISLDSAIEVMNLLFEQLAQKYLVLYKDKKAELIEKPEPLMKELDVYIDIIKHGIYKAGEA